MCKGWKGCKRGYNKLLISILINDSHVTNIGAINTLKNTETEVAHIIIVVIE